MTGFPNAGIGSFQATVLMRMERVLSAPWITGVSRPSEWIEKMNEHDRCALEIAMRLKAEQDWRVTGLAWSPSYNEEALRYALGRGADRAIFLDCGGNEEPDVMAICHMLAEVVEKNPFDLILCGTQSQGALDGPLAAFLAGLLDLPFVTRLVDGEVREGTLHARRSLERGVCEEVVCPLPAVVAVLSGEKPPAYVSVHQRAIVDVHLIERRPVSRPANGWSLKELKASRKRAQAGRLPAPGGSAAERMKRMLVGTKTGATAGAVFTGTPQAAAGRLLDYLREHGFIQNRGGD